MCDQSLFLEADFQGQYHAYCSGCLRIGKVHDINWLRRIQSNLLERYFWDWLDVFRMANYKDGRLLKSQKIFKKPRKIIYWIPV